MGYSARYHAASLAAVFLALAVGILIGVGLGENVVSDTEENLARASRGDIEDARAEADDLVRRTSTESEPSPRGLPGAGRRDGCGAPASASSRSAGLPADVVGNIEAMLEPTGAELAEVAVVRPPPDARAGSRLGPPFGGDRRRQPAKLEDSGGALGEQLVAGAASSSTGGGASSSSRARAAEGGRSTGP